MHSKNGYYAAGLARASRAETCRLAGGGPPILRHTDICICIYIYIRIRARAPPPPTQWSWYPPPPLWVWCPRPLVVMVPPSPPVVVVPPPPPLWCGVLVWRASQASLRVDCCWFGMIQFGFKDPLGYLKLTFEFRACSSGF